MSTSLGGTVQIAARIAVAVVGGYAFSWGFAVFGVAGLVALGVDFHEAESGVLMLALLVFLVVFLWAFSSASVARVWWVLAGGAAMLAATASAIQQQLMS